MKLDCNLESAFWPVLLVEDTGAVRGVNQAAIVVFGAIVDWPAPVLSSLWSPQNASTAEQFLAFLSRSGSAPISLSFRVKGGRTARFRAYICSLLRDSQHFYLFQLFPEVTAPVPAPAPPPQPAPTGKAGLAQDVAVTQKQKLDCAMQLIRTVVLDFNNALTSILGHTSLILGKMEHHHPWRNSLVEVEKSAQKAAEIAHDLAGFSRQERDTKTLSAGNLNDLLRRTIEILPVPASFKPEWRLELEKKLYAVHFDEAKTQQAFLKILDNAIQAVGDEALILIRTRNLDLSTPLRDGAASLGIGAYVCIEIVDNGCGMAPEILPRIFEPFFTTKPNHRGLGLAWVYGIVTNHGGSVVVESAPGRGTTVRLYLPAIKRFVKEQTFRDDELSGNQTILIVDDEALMLTMGQMVLSSFGYQVETADNGTKALEIFGKAGGKIDLVITDLVMPKMSGREFIERLRRQAPQVRVLCCSGYVRPAGAEEDEEMYLQKPFTSQELLRKVKQALT